MQIWRTTRSAPGTSRMKARLVRLWCFVLTRLFQKSLASLSIWSLCLALPTRFCVPECHRNRVESSTAEKVFFLSVSSFASEGKPKRRKQEVHDRRRNCKSSGWNRSWKMCKWLHLAPSCCHLAQCFHWFQRRGSWSSFAWLLHRSICFVWFRASWRERK